MSSQHQSAYGTFANVLRNFIDTECGQERSVTQTALIEVYKKQIDENIKTIEGYTGQNCPNFIPVSVRSFITRNKGKKIGYVINDNNRKTCVWKFPAFKKND
jgi:hypothetical protein